MTIYTIGHSTRSLDDFITLLKRAGVRHLADVRTFPSSRRYPHFNGAALERALAGAGIGYSHHPALGGRRTPRRDSRNTVWRNAGFRGYADYMEGDEFAAGLEQMMATAASSPTAIMCAEAVPWRCHRSLIADALVARGIDVQHILDAGTKPHTLTSFAVAREGRVSYAAAPRDAPRQAELFAADGSERVDDDPDRV